MEGKGNGLPIHQQGGAMIDVLISGRLRGTAAMRTSSKGTPFATWRMGAVDKNGDSVLCACITFSASAIEAVRSLSDGDSVSVSGEAAINVWDGNDGNQRHGLDVLAHVVMTAYHMGRKRRPAPGTEADSPL